MGTMGWLALVALGIALGFVAGRLWPSRKTKLAELEQERDQAREELGSYREEVNAHFERTAELFDKVTADYRGLYEHLALSARQLGAIQGESERSLEEPVQRRLGPVNPTEPEPQPEPQPEPEPEPKPEPEPEPEPGVKRGAEPDSDAESASPSPDEPGHDSSERRDA